MECTINGIGERAGNAALEEIAAAFDGAATIGLPYDLEHRDAGALSDQPVAGEDDQLWLLAEQSSRRCANAFAHESGIHQHGMLANPLTYEIMTPESVGVSRDEDRAGQAQRAAGARAERLERAWVSRLHREQLDEVYERFTELADRKKSIYEQDLARPVLQTPHPALVTPVL